MRWLIGAVALLIVAITLQLGLFAYAMYVLLGVIVASRVLVNTWSGNLTAVREMSRDRIKIGDATAIVIVVENRHWLPIPWMLVEDLLPRRALIHMPPNLQVTGRRLQLVSFRGRVRRTITYQLKANCRGYYQLGPLVAETGDVFGLYRRYRVLSEPSFLLVVPEVIPLEGFDIASRRPIGEVRMSHRLYEDPTRIAGVRAYQAGDSLNRVHWRATARTGQLQCKVYEPSTVAGATLLIDLHEQSFAPEDEPLRSELLITAAASVAGAIFQMGQQVGLVTNGRDAADRIRAEGWSHEQLYSRRVAQAAGMREKSDRLRPVIVPTRRSNTQLTDILRTLARVEKTDGFTFSQLVAEAASQLPQSASVIAMLTRVTPATAVALSNLRRRGMAVTAILNVFEDHEFAEMSAPLLSEQIETRHLKDRAAIPRVCMNYVLR
ncbi:MAG TPA: DUF58 domain-containing protein [Lacipirellulaceae bacterium]|nr:DUF58 domain-containing protein [Lacipirellulaceae bacterium]